MMKMIKMIVVLAAISGLFACKASEPEILDGPGMVYSDGENCMDSESNGT